MKCEKRLPVRVDLGRKKRCETFVWSEQMNNVVVKNSGPGTILFSFDMPGSKIKTNQASSFQLEADMSFVATCVFRRVAVKSEYRRKASITVTGS